MNFTGSKPCKDHEGQWYPSHKAMCKAWGISSALYHSRIARGWNKKKVLTTPARDRIGPIPANDHKGKRYKCLADMARAYGIDPQTLYSRLNSVKFESIEKALRPVTRTRTIEIRDHTGRVFNTFKEMCDFWGVFQKTYARRIRAAWIVKQALTAPTPKKIKG